jgi:hypothetical protein
VDGSCEQDNELSDYIKCLEVFGKLHHWRLLEKVSAPWIGFLFYVFFLSLTPYLCMSLPSPVLFCTLFNNIPTVSILNSAALCDGRFS